MSTKEGKIPVYWSAFDGVLEYRRISAGPIRPIGKVQENQWEKRSKILEIAEFRLNIIGIPVEFQMENAGIPMDFPC